VVLERIAYGAGLVNWYVCAGEQEFDVIVEELSPGSVVSFYFDDRIALRAYTPQLRAEMLATIDRTGDVQVGFMPIDGIHLSMEVVGHPLEVDEVADTIGSRSVLYCGAFPARDDDGVNAITVTMPDKDGVVRAHPH
jgi:hypothetical protein